MQALLWNHENFALKSWPSRREMRAAKGAGAKRCARRSPISPQTVHFWRWTVFIAPRRERLGDTAVGEVGWKLVVWGITAWTAANASRYPAPTSESAYGLP